MSEPSNKSAFEKRVKKHVIGKVHRFQAVAPLGFENTLVEELKYIGIEVIGSSNDAGSGRDAGKNGLDAGKNSDASLKCDAGIKVVGDGKVEFTAKITDAWKAVAYSRIANRVLIEVGNFKAENFGQLEKGVAAIPWELFLHNAPIALHTSCKHSRLYHSGAIEERIAPIIKKTLSLSPENPLTQNVYVTLQDDRCTLWLDLAGEELYKRGHERFVAEAPLKETIAAALLFEASKLTTNHQPQSTMVDPMAGSGTFSLEAAYIANGLIPGKCRDFALKHQPAFKEATWNFILKGSGDAVFNDVATPTIITSDISQRPIDIIRHNVESSPLAEIAASNPNAATINPQLKDFFSYTLDDIVASHTPADQTRVTDPAPQSSIILLNPPYGKRLDVDAPKLYTRIGRKLTELSQEAQSCGKSLTIAILAPKDCTANLLKTCPALDPLCNRKAKLIETSHGGFSLNAFIASL